MNRGRTVEFQFNTPLQGVLDWIQKVQIWAALTPGFNIQKLEKHDCDVR